MRNEYSLKSITYTNFYDCLLTLKNKIPCNDIFILDTYSIPIQKSFDIEKLKEVKEAEDLKYHFIFQKEEFEYTIKFYSYDPILSIELTGFEESIEKELFDLIENILGLIPPTEEDIRNKVNFYQMTKLLWDANDKIDELKSIILTKNQNIRTNCFLSFRFDDHSKSLAFDVKGFLELVKVNVLSGLGYEPRSVSEKVLDRLSQKVDLFILIHSQSGDSDWINQEIGVAKGRNIPIMVLKEEGTEQKSSLLGDNEYIEFPKDNISNCFIGILQALEYIENK